MRKASDLYELNQREQILLELFNRMDTNDQKENYVFLSAIFAVEALYRRKSP